AVIYIDYDNVTVANFTADTAIATGNGGVVYIDANNVTLINFKTSNSEANGNGGTVYMVGDNITVTDFKSTGSQAKEKGGAFYVNGNATMNNLTLENYDAKSGAAIYFETGNSTVSNSTFVGPNAIFVNKNVTVYLMKNNITGEGANKDKYWYLEDNSTSAVRKIDYSVWSDGILYLDKNTFDYVIFNNGTIKSPTHIYMLGNETWNNTLNDTFIFWAHIVDDLNNTIISVSSLNSSNQLYPDMSFAMPYNCIPLQTYLQGVFYLRAFDNTLDDCEEHNGTLYVKMPTNLVIEVGEEENENIPITIRITTPIDSNWTIIDQTVHIKFGDEIFDIVVNGINGYANGTHWVWDVATATFAKNHLHTGTYEITATYDGDGNHWGSQNNRLLIVNSRPIWISAHAEDIFYNETLYINVTSNATNTENGRITIRIDGKVYSIGLKLNDTGNGINETEEYFEWGYIVRDGVHDGLYIVPNKNFTQTLLPGEHTIEVMFDGGTYYAYQTNSSTFTVKKLNTDILVEYEDITYGQDELINVTVNENATGYISIRIGNRIYTSLIEQGIARFNITGLAVGTYSNINVTYYPVDDSGFSRNVTNITFKVDPINDYLIDIKVDEITYGQNATVRVFIPDATGEVTIYVDDIRKDNATLERGVAVLENIVGPDGLPLVGGQHSVRVVYEGCSIYGPNENSTTFTVGPTDNWDMTIPRITPSHYGENISIIVNTTGYNLAHDHVNITIDDIIYPVSIINGIANLTLNNLSAGSHAAFVEYDGDDNYAYKNKTFYVTVNQATPTVTITHEGGNVIATVSGNATGNVTFHVFNANGEEHVETITLNDGHQAIFEDVLGLGNNFITAEYNGDKNYTTKTAVT
ncbi:MAG: Ig-like domain repeat protein, partial [Methanobrevibacter sp.]|nr:Ig-like domain repeat protein [Methanobrevibacter sp.]